MRRPVIRGLVAMALVMSGAVALAGCAREAGPSAGGSTTTPTPLATGTPPSGLAYVGALTRSMTYAASGITLAPPPAGATAVVPWQTLGTACTRDAICAEGPGTITLARATSLLTGTVPDDSASPMPSGSLEPLMNDTLVYVLHGAGVPCASSGGPDRGGTPSTASKSTCQLIDFFDAGTGKVLFTVESPKP